MKARLALVAALLVISAGWAAMPAARATATVTCTWGGTSAAPAGTFTISPGLTNTPSSGPSAFYATGELAGDAGCRGTLTYMGQIDGWGNTNG